MGYVRAACENTTLSNIGHGSRYRQPPHQVLPKTPLTSPRRSHGEPGSEKASLLLRKTGVAPMRDTQEHHHRGARHRRQKLRRRSLHCRAVA
jgi:hypothetical protein